MGRFLRPSLLVSVTLPPSLLKTSATLSCSPSTETVKSRLHCGAKTSFLTLLSRFRTLTKWSFWTTCSWSRPAVLKIAPAPALRAILRPAPSTLRLAHHRLAARLAPAHPRCPLVPLLRRVPAPVRAHRPEVLTALAQALRTALAQVRLTRPALQPMTKCVA